VGVLPNAVINEQACEVVPYIRVLEKVTATFCAKHPPGLSGKRWLSPFLRRRRGSAGFVSGGRGEGRDRLGPEHLRHLQPATLRQLRGHVRPPPQFPDGRNVGLPQGLLRRRAPRARGGGLRGRHGQPRGQRRVARGAGGQGAFTDPGPHPAGHPHGPAAGGKGDSHLLCEAPSGPFRQKVAVTFSTAAGRDSAPQRRGPAVPLLHVSRPA
jgi:hypothetical protein